MLQVVATPALVGANRVHYLLVGLQVARGRRFLEAIHDRVSFIHVFILLHFDAVLKKHVRIELGLLGHRNLDLLRLKSI